MIDLEATKAAMQEIVAERAERHISCCGADYIDEMLPLLESLVGEVEALRQTLAEFKLVEMFPMLEVTPPTEEQIREQIERTKEP